MTSQPVGTWKGHPIPPQLHAYIVHAQMTIFVHERLMNFGSKASIQTYNSGTAKPLPDHTISFIERRGCEGNPGIGCSKVVENGEQIEVALPALGFGSLE
jgi:hypothetical protein